MRNQSWVFDGVEVTYDARHGIKLGSLAAEAVPAVAATLKSAVPEAAKVEGVEARAFAEEWSVAGGKKLDGIRLYRLEALTEVTAQGRPRLAVGDDIALVTRWIEDLAGPAGDWVENKVQQQLLWLWEDDGVPVSLVVGRPEGPGAVRLGPIYTPPEFRRRGYGAALTAHVCAMLPGVEVCLRTEVSNPFTQRIYQRIGFERVADFDRYELDPAVGAGDLD